MKLPVSVRIKLLVDENSFQAFAPEAPSICITGTARVGGRPVCLYALEHEPGPPIDMFASLQQANRIVETARRERSPLVMLLDAPGRSHTSAGRLYAELAWLSGEVPRVCALFGQTGAATVFPVALYDAAVMLEDAGVCIGRPDAVKHMVGEVADFEALGGARMHCTVSGLGDALRTSEQDAISWVRRYLAFFPDDRNGRPPAIAALAPTFRVRLTP